MADAPTTRLSLLLRLRDPADQDAWAHFVGLYAPAVYRFVRDRGLQDADAADVTQAVMLRVVRAIGGFDYDPRRGSFRGWLFTIACNQLRQVLLKGAQPAGHGSGDTGVQRLLEAWPARDDAEALWARAWEQQVFAWAADQVRADCAERTWRAFWRTAVEGASGKEVAAELGMSVAAVYLARGRVMTRIKSLIQEVQDD